MKKIYAVYKVEQNRYNTVLKNNNDAIMERNLFIQRITLITMTVVMLIALVGSFIFSEYKYMRLGYVIAVSVLMLLMLPLWLYGKKIVGWYMYFTFFVMIGYTILSSAYMSPDYICVTVLFTLFQFSLLYLDKHFRISITVIIAASVYIVTITHFKIPELIADEIINVICITIFSMIIGAFMRTLQVENIGMKNLLRGYAYRDQLTGLYNRRKFFELLAASEDTECAEPFISFAMIDIDYFKKYNDAFGHQAGDKCLKTIAENFIRFGEENDIEFFRYGGEEFIAADRKHSYDDFVALCERLRQKLEEIIVENPGGTVAKVTCSFGTAALTDGNDENNVDNSSNSDNSGKRKYEVLLSCADKALYVAKKNGRNRVVVYDVNSPDMDIADEDDKINGINTTSYRQRI